MIIILLNLNVMSCHQIFLASTPVLFIACTLRRTSTHISPSLLMVTPMYRASFDGFPKSDFFASALVVL